LNQFELTIKSEGVLIEKNIDVAQFAQIMNLLADTPQGPDCADDILNELRDIAAGDDLVAAKKALKQFLRAFRSY